MIEHQMKFELLYMYIIGIEHQRYKYMYKMYIWNLNYTTSKDSRWNFNYWSSLKFKNDASNYHLNCKVWVS